MDQLSKGRAEKAEVIVCPYCQNADRTLLDEEPPIGGLRKFECRVCAKVFVVVTEEATK